MRPKTALAYARLLAMTFYETITNKTTQDKEALIQLCFNQSKGSLSNLDAKYALDKDTLFIGFSETATGLAHSVFDAFSETGGLYMTTRESVKENESMIAFQEPHSHATSHRVYPRKNLPFESARSIVLVDDEISTGRSMLNIIEQLYKAYGIRSFHILSYLDWRNKDSLKLYDAFQSQNDLSISVHSLVKGEIGVIENGALSQETIQRHPVFQANTSPYVQKSMDDGDHLCIPRIYVSDLSEMGLKKRSQTGESLDYLQQTARFGLSWEEHDVLENKLKKIAASIQPYVNGKTLILGTEEFMYLPLRLASHLEGDVFFKSTTRSPIYPALGDYPIKSGLSFKSHYNTDVPNYIYNLEEEAYDTILVCQEQIAREITIEQDNMIRTMAPFAKAIYGVSFGSNKQKKLSHPPHMGTYDPEDVVFLLKEIKDGIEEQDNATREKAIQSGVHYSGNAPCGIQTLGRIHWHLRKIFGRSWRKTGTCCGCDLRKNTESQRLSYGFGVPRPGRHPWLAFSSKNS